MFEYDGPSYQSSSGFRYSPAAGNYGAYKIENFTCAGGSFATANPYFTLYANTLGPLRATNPIGSTVEMEDVQVCDTTGKVVDHLSADLNLTSDGARIGSYWNQSSTNDGKLGILPDSMLSLHNTYTGQGSAGPYPFGIDPLERIFISQPFVGSVVSQQVVPPAIVVTSSINPGTASATYHCTAVDGAGMETNLVPPQRSPRVRQR